MKTTVIPYLISYKESFYLILFKIFFLVLNQPLKTSIRMSGSPQKETGVLKNVKGKRASLCFKIQWIITKQMYESFISDANKVLERNFELDSFDKSWQIQLEKSKQQQNWFEILLKWDSQVVDTRWKLPDIVRALVKTNPTAAEYDCAIPLVKDSDTGHHIWRRSVSKEILERDIDWNENSLTIICEINFEQKIGVSIVQERFSRGIELK